MTTSTLTAVNAPNLNTVLHGDCVEIIRGMPPASIDFVITDPPYIIRYCDRSGRCVANDDNRRWLKPAFAQMHWLLKSAAFCVSFYGWNKADLFITHGAAPGSGSAATLSFAKNTPRPRAFCATSTNRHICWSRASHCRPRSRSPT